MAVNKAVFRKFMVMERENAIPWLRLVTYRDADQTAGAGAKIPPMSGPLVIPTIATAVTTKPPSKPLNSVRVQPGLLTICRGLAVAILLLATRTTEEDIRPTARDRRKSFGVHTAAMKARASQSPRAMDIRTQNDALLGTV